MKENFNPEPVLFCLHARERMYLRGTNESEVALAISRGEMFDAKFGRKGFRKIFFFDKSWRGKYYRIKQLEVYAVLKKEGWFVVSVITRYF